MFVENLRELFRGSFIWARSPLTALKGLLLGGNFNHVIAYCHQGMCSFVQTMGAGSIDIIMYTVLLIVPIHFVHVRMHTYLYHSTSNTVHVLCRLLHIQYFLNYWLDIHTYIHIYT